MSKLINTNKALKVAKDEGIEITLVTLIKWCQPFPDGFNIGVKVGGRWKVNQNKLKLVLSGKQWLLVEREREKLLKEKQ